MTQSGNTSYSPIGYALGQLLNEFFDYSIPVYVYDEYGKSDTNQV